MSRSTIDFGIDLGTTNSAIAVLDGVGTNVIKNNVDQDVTASAVAIGRDEILVGHRARNKIKTKPDDGYVEFKRQMGTDHAYQFRTSGVEMRPETLSAEVLKSLRADVARSLGEEIHSAVITVPAAFELNQCDATRKAAELSGLGGSPLLQEPVAAALAYGFQIDSEKAYWLTYDFGGGTFDAALIKAEEGMINVVHHGGDNFLGGSDLDWDILERIIIPKLVENFNLPDFKRGSSRWRKELILLKWAVEMAKIELTTKGSTTLMDCVFEDESGDEVDCEEIVLTQLEVAGVAEPLIMRSVDFSRQVLADKGLPAAGVEKVILVGGPTKAPYFRDILEGAIKIPLDYSCDPLTVVARGAAVFAGTQKMSPSLFRKADAGEYRIDLEYKPVGHETDPFVGGKVSAPKGAGHKAFSIEFVNTGSQWRSGRLSLREDGSFMGELRAEKGERNTFQIELYDNRGTKQRTVPDSFTYTVGAVVEEQVVTNSMGVALANNEVVWFFEKGSALPQKKREPKPFFTTKEIKVGEDGVALVIPVVEGDNRAADRNRLEGKLEVTSEMIKRDLPAGSEIEVTLKMDESRIITTEIYVVLLDEEFEKTLDLRKQGSIGAPELEGDFEQEMERLRGLVEKADEAGDDQASDELAEIEDSPLVDELRRSISAAKGDPNAAVKAENRLLELKLKLDSAENIVEWPALVADARKWLDDLDDMALRHGDEHNRDQAQKLGGEANEIIERKEPDRLKRKIKQIQDIFYQILFSVPAFWVSQFQKLEGQASMMSDTNRADRLFEMGRRYMEEDNISGLRNVVNQLWDLLPREVAEEIHRGYGSTLIR